MILTLNAGSSSLKYAVFPADAAEELAGGLFERLGEGDATHASAFAELGETLGAEGLLAGIRAVGHRVVHGGEEFRAPVAVDDDVEAAIERLSSLAPLHNPVNLLGIRLARELLGAGVRHVAVFDTAFHATLPPRAYRYAVPTRWYEEFGVRKYGFHGTSHAYVSARAREVLAEAERPAGRIVTLHLGNGCSAAAVLDGRCVDTTMGLTPLAGLVMGTRAGDVDPGLAGYLAERGVDVAAQTRALNRESGLLGLAGDNDMRALLARRDAGDARAGLAVDVFVYRLRKTVGALAAALGGLDALVFTAGIGENASAVREEVCAGLGFLGVDLDRAAAEAGGGDVTWLGGGGAAVLVVATDEERAIALATVGEAILRQG